MQVPLGLTHRPGLGRDVEVRLAAAAPHDQLGAPAADVDHDRERPGLAGGGRAQEREPRLLVAGDRAGVDPEALAHRSAELVAVGAVAHGARGDGDRSLGAVLVDRGAVLGQGREDALHGGVGEPARSVDAVAEPRDLRAAVELRYLATGHVGHQKAGRVRAKVDDRYAHPGSLSPMPIFGSSDGPRAPADASDLAGMELENHAGEVRRLGELWEDGPAVLVFLRHYG
jgi:hypothetical protein